MVSATRHLVVTFLAVLLSIGASRSLLAQTTGAARMFISPSATAPTLENPTIHIRTGQTLTLSLWWKRLVEDGRVSAIGHDVAMSNSILSRTDYTIDNPFVSGANRWGGVQSANPAAGLLVNDANTIKLGGSSMGFATTADPRYDAATDSYRFSTLTVTATAAGRTELRIGVGDQTIAFTTLPPETLINFGFGDDAVRGDSSARTTSSAVTTLADAIIYVADAETPWLNPALSFDVNADGAITPIDALLIINELNENGTHDLAVPPAANAVPPYFDPDGDNIIKPIDALLVINELNGASQSSASLAASTAAAVPEPGSAALAGLALVALALTSIMVRRKYLSD